MYLKRGGESFWRFLEKLIIVCVRINNQGKQSNNSSNNQQTLSNYIQ